MLYLKEMDEGVYGKLCAVRLSRILPRMRVDVYVFYQAYFSAASSLHMTQIRAFLVACAGMVKKGVDDDNDGVLCKTLSVRIF